MTLFRSRSLAARLVGQLVLVQIAVVIVWILAFMAFSPYLSYEVLAAATAHARVVDAVEPAPDGSLRIGNSPELEAYAARRPGFAFAVLQDQVILSGSSPTLASTLAPFAGQLPRSGELDLRGLGLARFIPIETAYGELTTVTIGNIFLAEDAPTFLYTYLPQFALMFGPAILAAAMMIPFVVRRTMAPVRIAADRAAAIELSSLDRRLPATGAPHEGQP